MKEKEPKVFTLMAIITYLERDFIGISIVRGHFVPRRKGITFISTVFCI